MNDFWINFTIFINIIHRVKKFKKSKVPKMGIMPSKYIMLVHHIFLKSSRNCYISKYFLLNLVHSLPHGLAGYFGHNHILAVQSNTAIEFQNTIKIVRKSVTY